LSSKKILACDLGTGGNKASLFDADGVCLESSFVPCDTIYPRSGWHEQRPKDWWKAVVQSTQKLLSRRSDEAGNIECISISGHSLGAVPLDARGKLLRESTPIWSDTRSEDEVKEFFRIRDERSWYMCTGNGFPPACYTLFKILWYRNNEPEMFRRVAQIIGTKDYINYRLTGNICTDYSYASGSGVYDLQGWEYDADLIEDSGLPRRIFPDLVPSTQVVGELSPEAARELGLSRNVKVVSGGVDNSCMALEGADPRPRATTFRFRPRDPRDVHLGGEHLRRRQLPEVGAGQPLCKFYRSSRGAGTGSVRSDDAGGCLLSDRIPEPIV
jgi:xylulokinase